MLRCTIEPDLLNRNRPEDRYTMQDMFYIMNIKVCNAGKTLAVLLLCSERGNKGVVNGILYSLLSQAVQKFKLFCCQVSLQNYVALENAKRKVIKTFTQNRNYGLLEKKKCFTSKNMAEGFQGAFSLLSVVVVHTEKNGSQMLGEYSKLFLLSYFPISIFQQIF